MKGQVAISLNDDDTLSVAASIPLDAERAKVYHYGFDFEDMGAALAKVGEQIMLIKERHVEPKVKSNVVTL